MALKIFILSLVYFQVATSQYYAVPVASYPSFYNSYYPSTSTSFATNPPRQSITTPKLPKLQPKRSTGNSAGNVKTLPQTASAYFLSSPTDKIKATVLTKDKIKETSPVPYSCPLCNNFADIPRNPKLQPPPPVSPVLPGIIDTVPAITIPKSLTSKDTVSTLAEKLKIPDMCNKHKVAKKLSFDQELLDGFLTGLGISI